MEKQNNMKGILTRLFLKAVFIVAIYVGLNSCGNRSAGDRSKSGTDSTVVSIEKPDDAAEEQTITVLLVSPENPRPGQIFRVMVTGGKDIRKAEIKVTSPSGAIKSEKTRSGDGLPYWQIVEFKAGSEGKYHVSIDGNGASLDFHVTAKPSQPLSNAVWNTKQGWDSKTEALYSAWINALFQDSNESASWKALNETTENRENNFLYNHLSLGEDDSSGKIKVLMEPDCADNPFYLRAYFSWKLGLPFGYHECDRGYLGKAPGTGRWITNEANISRNSPTQKFNAFARMIMNGVHSGTARTAFKDESSDYYPIPLTHEALRPGAVFADPYGHTLILVRTIPQTSDSPGVLLAVDAQPDKTVAIKRFWKGNFLYNTNEKEVIGEPGFKAFRPIVVNNGKLRLLKSNEINANSELVPFSLQQKGMESTKFYHTMERVINPKPMDPEMALLDLINALNEQLNVRVNSVGNGEEYMKSHPGTVVPMPGGTSGVFQAGGQWEDFSTPNRDLRLLIAMDAVQDFPNKIVRSPDDYKLSMLQSPEKVKKNLEELLDEKTNELSITYTRSDGSKQRLTIAEILKRKEAFEMAYNPNDGAEIRWGAPENSAERSTCKRHVPAGQLDKMQKVRIWFQKRLHPPT
jgi:hypothetical protein